MGIDLLYARNDALIREIPVQRSAVAATPRQCIPNVSRSIRGSPSASASQPTAAMKVRSTLILSTGRSRSRPRLEYPAPKSSSGSRPLRRNHHDEGPGRYSTNLCG
jgi:hypothetical protein